MLWGIEVPEFGRLVSAVHAVGYTSAWSLEDLSFVTVEGAPSRWKEDHKPRIFRSCLSKCLLFCLTMCMKSNWISPNNMNWKKLCLIQHIYISHHQFHYGWI
jgi:hypothetical protein